MISVPSTSSPVTTTDDLWEEAHIQAAAATGEIVHRALRKLREPDSSINHVEIPCPEHDIYDFQCQWCVLNNERARIARNVSIAQKRVEESIGTNELDNAYYNFLIAVQEEVRSNQAFERILYSKGPSSFFLIQRLKSKSKLTSDRASIMQDRFRPSHYRIQKLKGEHRHG